MGWAGSDETVDFRLLRSRIAHLFTEHHQRTHWLTFLAPNLVFGVADARLYRVVRPAVALPTETSQLLLLRVLHGTLKKAVNRLISTFVR
jgi:hypothetical protein